MSEPATDVVTIPARITVEGLSEAIDREVDQIAAELEKRQEPHGLDDVLAAQVAVEVASVLGVKAEVEARDLALEHLYIYESVGEVRDIPSGRAGHLVKGVTTNLDALDSALILQFDAGFISQLPP